jgi:hypothetical protein
MKTALLGVFAAAMACAGTFTNTGSASLACQWDGTEPQPPQTIITVNFTGTDINATCPARFQGNTGNGFAHNLAVRIDLNPGGPSVTFVSMNFHSTFNEQLVATGGTGSGIVEFTIMHTWLSAIEFGLISTSADLKFNGNQVWSGGDGLCNLPGNCFIQHNDTIVVDEPITYGVPFSFQASENATGSGNGAGFSTGNSSLVITELLTTGGQLAAVPEPFSVALVGGGLLCFGLFRKRLNDVTN